uniref:hypothetical protein n=1 Tax=Enterocloster asparagiformis TaxID=333367 RepID=UPI000465685D
MADLGKVVVTDGGNYSASVTYEKLTFVHYQGDAYMTLKTVKGVTPTDDGTNYKLFCKSAELATATKAGIVLPDGTTTTVDGNGKISVKKATTSAAGIVKPAATDFIMAADGTQKINTQFTQATELANIIAGEAIAQVWGKVSKAIATTMNLDQNALLKNMISNIAVNDPDKLNSAAYIYTLVERIGMGTELAVGANLTDGLNKVNSDLGDLSTDLSNIHTELTPLKSYYVNNINNNIVNKVNIVLWDANTADSPFKAGNTIRGNGFCITYSSGEPYLCQLAMAVGDSNLFTRHRSQEGWSGWTT